MRITSLMALKMHRIRVNITLVRLVFVSTEMHVLSRLLCVQDGRCPWLALSLESQSADTVPSRASNSSYDQVIDDPRPPGALAAGHRALVISASSLLGTPARRLPPCSTTTRVPERKEEDHAYFPTDNSSLSSMSTRILIVGATGKQGSAVLRSLRTLPNPPKVRALTRNTDSPSALSLKKRGVEVVKGSLEDVASLKTALRDVDAAFLGESVSRTRPDSMR